MQTVVAMQGSKGPESPSAAPAEPVVPVAARPTPAAVTAAPRQGFLPLLLGLLALATWLCHQGWLINQERQQLQAATTQLQPTVDKAAALRKSLDLLAADTQRLADTGHGNARVLVEELRKRGITINSAGTPASGAAR